MRLLSYILLLASLLGAVSPAPTLTTDVEVRSLSLEARQDQPIPMDSQGQYHNTRWTGVVQNADASNLNDLYKYARRGFNWLRQQEYAFNKNTKACLVAALYDPRTRTVYMSTPPRLNSPPNLRDNPDIALVWRAKWKAHQTNGNTHAEDGAYVLMETENSFNGAATRYEYPIGQDKTQEGSFMVAVYGVKWTGKEGSYTDLRGKFEETDEDGKVPFCDYCDKIAQELLVFNDYPKLGDKLS